MGQARVSVEHRFFGLDRRTLPYALGAIAVFVLWTVVLPWINSGIAWDDTIQAGERVRLADDVSFAPATGWGLLAGLRTTDSTASGQRSTASVAVTSDGVQFTAQQGEWNGTPRALLHQITKITTTEAGPNGFELSSRPTTVETASGATGAVQGFRSARVEGLIAAFVFGGTGIQIQIVGPPGQLSHHADELVRMLASIRQEDAR
jgi:hypothetical protein